MKLFERIRHGIHFDVVWFAEESANRAGITTYHQALYEGKNATEFITLVNDLTEDADAIKGHFAKNCRYEVNRASREDVSYIIKKPSDITDEDITEFLTFFESFWESKGMKFEEYDSVKRDLSDFRDNDALFIGIGVVEGQKAIYHTYVCDDNKSRLLHSASLFRLQDTEETNKKGLLGIANRYLHYQEMLFFKNEGMTEYDWGGAGTTSDTINITKFKESFGGEHRTYYDFEEVRGIKAHIFKILVSILDDAMN